MSDSQALFDSAVIKAGESLGSLQGALDQTAKNAADTGISFTIAKQNLLAGTQIGQQMGLINPAAAATVMNAAFTGSGQRIGNLLQSVPNQIDQWSQSLAGQSLVANQLGIPMTSLFGWAQTHGGSGSIQYKEAELGAIQHLMQDQ
jgi:hypothetical protein